MFDPDLFLAAQQTEVNEARELFPVSNPADAQGLYLGVVGEVTTASGTIGKGDRTGQPWISVVIPIEFDVPQRLQSEKSLPARFKFTDRVFLDLTPDGKGIDNSKGKNVSQRMYREALDMNKPGEPFSWKNAQGRPIKFQLAHEMYEGRIIEKVKAVFRA